MTDPVQRAAHSIRSRIASFATRVASDPNLDDPSEERVVRLLDALAQALESRDVGTLVSHLRNGSDGVALLRATREVLSSELGSDVAVGATSFLDAASEQIASWEPDTDDEPAAPSSEELQGAYLDALLRGDRQGASRLVLDAVDAGMDVRLVYSGVFQPALYEVGRLWQRNVVTVAQEHYITAATQLIMSQLYPRIFSTQRKNRRFVATCVSGELHEVGVRMVADFFEMDGWDTYYLGANVPPEEVVAEAINRDANVVGVSATLPAHIPQVHAVIEAVRDTSGCESIRTIVGGQAFAFESDAWRRIGADAYAVSADDAVRLANRWVGGR